MLQSPKRQYAKIDAQFPKNASVQRSMLDSKKRHCAKIDTQFPKRQCSMIDAQSLDVPVLQQFSFPISQCPDATLFQCLNVLIIHHNECHQIVISVQHHNTIRRHC